MVTVAKCLFVSLSFISAQPYDAYDVKTNSVETSSSLERSGAPNGPMHVDATKAEGAQPSTDLQRRLKQLAWDEARQVNNPVEAIPLSPSSSLSSERQDAPAQTSPAQSIVTIISALAIVLGLFFLLVWISRRGTSHRLTGLSKEVVEVLGQTPLSARQQLHLISIGNKLLLVAVALDGAQTLTEIDNLDEVLQIRSLCEQSKSGSATSSFREVFSKLNTEPVEREFLG